jgi:NAD(P)-dependent dehydrogenase (short-subunit alcohol dehydrogenase family)
MDLKDRKIRVNILSPGPTNTPMLGDTKEKSDQIVQFPASSSPMG